MPTQWKLLVPDHKLPAALLTKKALLVAKGPWRIEVVDGHGHGQVTFTVSCQTSSDVVKLQGLAQGEAEDLCMNLNKINPAVSAWAF